MRYHGGPFFFVSEQWRPVNGSPLSSSRPPVVALADLGRDARVSRAGLSELKERGVEKPCAAVPFEGCEMLHVYDREVR
jgi:hypothetical protein